MKVFSNLAISIDGKIADRAAPTRSLGTITDRERMNEIRAMADAVLIGAATLRTHPRAMKGRSPDKRPLLNVIVSRSGDLDPTWPFWTDANIIRFVFTTRRGFRRASESSRDRAFVVLAGEENVDAKKILEVLKNVGVKRLLIEGGGEIMRLFIDAHLLDELFVTLTPKLLGGVENPALVAGAKTLEPWVQTKILACKKIRDEVYLHYKVQK